MGRGGLAAWRVLRVAQSPEISPPVVTVTAVYPGASAQVLESTVAAPIENAINGVEDMLYMSSTSSSSGVVQIQVTFNIGANIDKAALNVNNRAKQVEPRLPLEVRRQGLTVEKGSSAFLQVLAFYSPDNSRDEIFISNYVTLNILDEVKRIPGTTLVQIFGAKDYAMRIWLQPDRLVSLKLTPGGAATLARFAELAKRAPGGITYAIPFDTTEFVEVSIREVVKTLGEAMLLVFLVVYLFLQSWRATLIPFAAVPVSLIGTFAGLLLLGYSINTLTLFGMVLAIGIVVDDAIVVLENVERIMHEEGLAKREAAIKAMTEVTSPIIAIVLVLCAVFVPIAFLGGLTGELYRQFAVTISMAVVISGFVALTLTPALCVIVLKEETRPKRGFFALFNRGFSSATDHYESGVAWIIRRGGVGLALFAIMVAAAAYLWRITPGSLVPDEDQGFYIAAVILPDGATLERTDKVVDEVTKAIQSNPANLDVVAFTGFDFLGGGFRNNAATIFVTQVPWHERKVATPQVVGDFFMKTGHIKEGLALAFGPPAIFGLGTAGGFEFYIQNRGNGGSQQMAQALGAFLRAAHQDRRLGVVQTLLRAAGPPLYVDVDPEKAKALRGPLEGLYGTLAATLGTYYVNDFNKFGRTWQVLMSAEPQSRNRPDDVGKVWIRSEKGEMIPLASLAKVRYSAGPDSLDRFNNLPAVKVFGPAAPGVSSGQAIQVVEELADKTLPRDFSYDWGGTSYQEKRSAGTAGLALALAVIMVFFILTAQYEKWTLPLSELH